MVEPYRYRLVSPTSIYYRVMALIDELTLQQDDFKTFSPSRWFIYNSSKPDGGAAAM